MPEASRLLRRSPAWPAGGAGRDDAHLGSREIDPVERETGGSPRGIGEETTARGPRRRKGFPRDGPETAVALSGSGDHSQVRAGSGPGGREIGDPGPIGGPDGVRDAMGVGDQHDLLPALRVDRADPPAFFLTRDVDDGTGNRAPGGVVAPDQFGRLPPEAAITCKVQLSSRRMCWPSGDHEGGASRWPSGVSRRDSLPSRFMR